MKTIPVIRKALIASCALCISLTCMAQIEFAPLDAQWSYAYIEVGWNGSDTFNVTASVIAKATGREDSSTLQYVRDGEVFREELLIKSGDSIRVIYPTGESDLLYVFGDIGTQYEYNSDFAQTITITDTVSNIYNGVKLKDYIGYIDSGTDRAEIMYNELFGIHAVRYSLQDEFAREHATDISFWTILFSGITDVGQLYTLLCYSDPVFGSIDFDETGCEIRTSTENLAGSLPCTLRGNMIGSERLAYIDCDDLYGELQYNLLSLHGQSLAQGMVINSQIDLSGVIAGTYYLQIVSDDMRGVYEVHLY